MNRRAFIFATTGTLIFTASPSARGQATKAVRRIGFLSSGAPLDATLLQQMYAPLRELGWIEGQNLLVERRYSGDKPELLQLLAEELVRLEVELIITDGTDALVAAKNATSTIPIVIRSAGDPVRMGLVASFARPGGNITGYSTMGTADLEKKRVGLLRELLPSMQRVGRLDSSTNIYYRAVREEFEQAYRSVGVTPIFIEIARIADLEGAIAEMVRARALALVVGADNFIWDNRIEVSRTAV